MEMCVWGQAVCVKHLKDDSMDITNLPAQSAASRKMMH